MGSALSTTGDSFALDSLAAVIVGGVALSGGRGEARSASSWACFLIGLISNALIIMNVNPYLRDVVIGLIIVAAVTVSELFRTAENIGRSFSMERIDLLSTLRDPASRVLPLGVGPRPHRLVLRRKPEEVNAREKWWRKDFPGLGRHAGGFQQLMGHEIASRSGCKR